MGVAYAPAGPEPVAARTATMQTMLIPSPYFFRGRWCAVAVLPWLALAACTPLPPVPPVAMAPVPAVVGTAPAAAPVAPQTPGPPDTTDPDAISQRFAAWIQALRVSARQAGIDEATLHRALDSARYLPGVMQSDRVQPEFNRAVWDYLDTALSAQRIARGQARLQQLRGPGGMDVDALTRRYGVPVEVLVAIWGMESSYGANTGDIATIDALATLGFEGRRAQWARGELLAALKILQNGDIDRDRMLGSWAGAMGQTQFLPSSFLAYAVDADGDGKRDIWDSVPDVMASTANFLARSGWQAGQSWGTEVTLPAGFDYALAASTVRRTSAQWAQAGVQAVDGSALPDLPDSSIVLPAGARGPAFLVGPNFRVVLRYNNATSYALAVSLLAQRLAGGLAVQAAWPRESQPLTRSQIQTLQSLLNAQGFDTGLPDGLSGPATQAGIRSYQRSLGLPPDGFATQALLQQLVDSDRTRTPEVSPPSR